jgi:hypothetical protein
MCATNDDEDADWQRLTLEQFLQGYCEGDAIYDDVEEDDGGINTVDERA